MSSVTILLILLINYLSQVITSNQCDFPSAIDLQSATYSHSLILRVQPINFSEAIGNNLITRKVLIREVIKISPISNHQIQINDMIIIRIDQDLDAILDHSCWHLLRLTTIDIILFLNQTNTNEFDLRYPPVESTFRVRENLDTVLNYETYSPQVIIKTRITKPILSKSYSLQCNTRGNPLPRLLWSKNNETLGYYPSVQECQTACRIYSIQNKYQSILYFQSLIKNDSGIYICHAQNAINHTMGSVDIHIDQRDRNLTCASLKSCHHRGQCILIDIQLKYEEDFLIRCDQGYFGEQCETNYDEIIKKQNNTILLFKSRFIVGCMIFLIGFILVLIIFISCVLARNNQSKREESSISKPITNGEIEQLNQQAVSAPVVQRVIDDGDGSQMSTKMTNHFILSESYSTLDQPDLIQPLTLQIDTPPFL